MYVYRITSKKHSADINGAGAAMYPGRWNHRGVPVLYTGESKEIALLETLVHVPVNTVPELDIVTLEIPGNSILKVTKLPVNWKEYPAPLKLADIAQKWIDAGKYIAMRVPSCIIESSNNYILNCQHPDFLTKVRIIDRRPFVFDTRLKGS